MHEGILNKLTAHKDICLLYPSLRPESRYPVCHIELESTVLSISLGKLLLLSGFTLKCKF